MIWQVLPGEQARLFAPAIPDKNHGIGKVGCDACLIAAGS
jgi:hypothetical protein